MNQINQSEYNQVTFNSGTSKISGWFFKPDQDYTSVIILTTIIKKGGLNVIARFS